MVSFLASFGRVSLEDCRDGVSRLVSHRFCRGEQHVKFGEVQRACQSFCWYRRLLDHVVFSLLALGVRRAPLGFSCLSCLFSSDAEVQLHINSIAPHHSELISYIPPFNDRLGKLSPLRPDTGQLGSVYIPSCGKETATTHAW